MFVKCSSMRSVPRVKIYQRSGHQKKDGTFPIHVSVSFQRKTKYYKTGLSLTKEAYYKSYKAKSPRGENLTIRRYIDSHLQRAKEILRMLDPFSFGSFELHFYQISEEQDDVLLHFDQKIKELTSNQQFSSNESYKEASKKLKKFFISQKKHRILRFDLITCTSLVQFERWMLDNDYSPSTIGIYLRNLRHIFNRAIDKKVINSSLYPFGQGLNKYSIPQSKNIKKGLDVKLINAIKNLKLSNEPIKEKARDFWLLCFLCNGINLNDLLRITKDQLTENTLTFVRRKTARTRKVITPTQVELIPLARAIINKYANMDSHPEQLQFKILNARDSEEQKRRKIKSFTRYVNQHISILGNRLGYSGNISAIHARHSWASLAINKGVPIEYISMCLSHDSIQTTKSYIKGLDRTYLTKTTNKIFEDFT